MGEYRRRTPKKPEHPVREWISDNLRYFMLFGGILLIILIAVLAVKLISGKMGDNASIQPAVKSESVAEESNSATDIDHMDSNVSETPVPEVTPETEEKPAEEEMTKETDSSIAANLVHKYFEGLSAKDPQAVRYCVDVFTEEDSRQVLENTQITSYSDVEVYTCDGLDEQSKVAFVSYSYTMAGSDVAIPALTEFYVYDTGDGDWRLASDVSDAEIQNRVKELAETEAVQEMIRSVQEKFDQVQQEHPELQLNQ